MMIGIKEHLLPSWIFRLPKRASGCIALTFDDGPDRATTPLLLAELARLSIASTHFIVGEKAEKHSSLVSQISDSGGTIGNHGFDHRSFLLLSGRAQKSSILRTAEAVSRCGVASTSIFRPPYGRFNMLTPHVLKETGHTGILWSHAIGDWNPVSEQELWNRLQRSLRDRAVILLHDAHASTRIVIRLLPRLRDEIHSRGWHFCTLSPNFIPTPS